MINHMENWEYWLIGFAVFGFASISCLGGAHFGLKGFVGVWIGVFAIIAIIGGLMWWKS